MRYAIINGSNVVVNIILWDGQSAFDPGEGLTLIHDPNGEAEIGGTYDGAFHPAP